MNGIERMEEEQKRGFFVNSPILGKIAGIMSRFFTPKSVLTRTINEMEAEKQVIEKQYEELNHLHSELNRKMRQLIAAQDTGKAILSLLNLDQLLSTIMNIFNDVCKVNRVLIMLRNENEKYIEFVHGTGFSGSVPEDIRNYRVPLSRVGNIISRVFNTGMPEYVADIKDSTLEKENIFLSTEDPTSAYLVPLITRSHVIGVIAIDAADGKEVPEETRETLRVFAPQIAIAIENARLYRELQDQMVELKESRAMLCRADKFAFLSNLAKRLAREIKDPIWTIGKFIRMLPEKFDDEAFRERFYTMALEETNRVNDLISELLNLVRTKEPELMLSDLHDLIEKTILLISPHSNAKEIEIVRHFDPDIAYVWMDSEKMKQVILNILSNAVEFTREHGKIEIATENIVKQDEPNCISIRIRDSGIGIPESMSDKIFDPYFSTKSDSDTQNGSGLGLFIAQQNIAEHGGSIVVKNHAGEGTEFILALPFEPPE